MYHTLKKPLHDRLHAYYVPTFREHGATPAGMGYNGADQIRQYEVVYGMMGVFGYQEADVVADLGCGFKAGRRKGVNYCGIDINPEVHPDILGDHRIIDATDWTVMCGIFNVGYRWNEVKDVVGHCFKVSEKGIGVTFIRTKDGRIGDPKISCFPLMKWVTLFNRLGKWSLLDGWDENLAAAVIV